MILSTYPDNHNFSMVYCILQRSSWDRYRVTQEFLTFIPFNLPPRAIAIVSLLLGLIIKSIAF